MKRLNQNIFKSSISLFDGPRQVFESYYEESFSRFEIFVNKYFFGFECRNLEPNEIIHTGVNITPYTYEPVKTKIVFFEMFSIDLHNKPNFLVRMFSKLVGISYGSKISIADYESVCVVRVLFFEFKLKSKPNFLKRFLMKKFLRAEINEINL